EFFDLRVLGESVDKIPSEVDVLLIAEPYDLTSRATYAIDQYVLGGGKALVLVDPVPEASLDASLGQIRGGLDELKKILTAWGVGFDEHQVAADLAHARRVRFGSSQAIADYVAWLGLDSGNIDKNDAISAGVDTLNLASTGFLTKIDGAGTTFTPILYTGAEAMQVGASKVGPAADPITLLRTYQPGGKPLVLAARVSGEAKSAFSEPPPLADTNKEHGASVESAPDAKPDELKGSHLAWGKVNAIVIADTDLMADQFWVDRSQVLGQEVDMPNAQNAALIIGALENLSGNDALIALRGRGVANRPFTLVDQLRRQAELQFQEKEQQLSQRLSKLQTELAKLESSGGDSAILSDDERQAAEKFRVEMVETRRELRDVKLALHRDVDRLDGWVKFVDIALVPLAIGAIGTGWSFWRTRKRKGKNQVAANEGVRA
ncbi:MAG TPA: Gldg family protein, partial [Hyphomicrobium sp.]